MGPKVSMNSIAHDVPQDHCMAHLWLNPQNFGPHVIAAGGGPDVRA